MIGAFTFELKLELSPLASCDQKAIVLFVGANERFKFGNGGDDL